MTLRQNLRQSWYAHRHAGRGTRFQRSRRPIFSVDERLFKAHSPGSRLDHFLVQAKWILTGGKEGGFYVMIGRKKTEPAKS